MATLDSVTEDFGQSGQTSRTVSHTCTGSDLILFVGVRYGEANGTDCITGITYDGDSMTKVNSVKNDNNYWTAMFMLVAPATGANNVVVSYSPASLSDLVIVSYTGAEQTSQPDAEESYNTGNVTSYASLLTTVSDNCFVICWNSGNVKPNAGTGSTAISTDDSAGGVMYAYSSNPKTPAGQVSMTQTSVSSGINTTNIVSFVSSDTISSFVPKITII